MPKAKGGALGGLSGKNLFANVLLIRKAVVAADTVALKSGHGAMQAGARPGSKVRGREGGGDGRWLLFFFA